MSERINAFFRLIKLNDRDGLRALVIVVICILVYTVKEDRNRTIGNFEMVIKNQQTLLDKANEKVDQRDAFIFKMVGDMERERAKMAVQKDTLIARYEKIINKKK